MELSSSVIPTNMNLATGYVPVKKGINLILCGTLCLLDLEDEERLSNALVSVWSVI